MFCKQNPAKVHLTQIVGDKMQKVDLCEECAKQKGVNDPAGFSLADLLLGLGASQEIAQTSGGEEIKCPNCGFTQADFKKAGRLGCSQCYTTFAEGLEGLLKSMHKGTKHVGKVPARPAPEPGFERSPETFAEETGQGRDCGGFRAGRQLCATKSRPPRTR